MGAYCLNNNFKTPPPGFKRPKRNHTCKLPIWQWCSSHKIAKQCNVILNIYQTKKNKNPMIHNKV